MQSLFPGEKPYECHICGRPFAERHTMLCHAKIHNAARKEGPPQLECTYCGEKFHFFTSLRYHSRTKHEGYIEKRCRSVFVNCEVLYSHLGRFFYSKEA